MIETKEQALNETKKNKPIPEIKEPQYFKEICENCGCTYGAHCAAAYYNKVYKIEIPQDCCPGHEGRMDWDRGPGTAFKSSGIYKEEIC